MLQKPRGTRDFLPDEMEARRAVEWKLREVARCFGYREVCTPEFEDLELFTARSGDGIIEEMYVFEDTCPSPGDYRCGDPDVHQ
jgi:histidyl-tRNA synthetase